MLAPRRISIDCLELVVGSQLLQLVNSYLFLNAMRKGRVRREYIDALFWKDDAVDIVFKHVLEKVPQAIVGANRKRIVEEGSI